MRGRESNKKERRELEGSGRESESTMRKREEREEEKVRE